MKTRILVFALVVLWIGQSCNLATTVHFNRDYSGNYETVLDMSELMGFAAMMDTTGEMEQNDMIEKMRHSIDSLQLEEKYNAISGIHDANVEVTDDGKVAMAFAFDNVEALNASFTAMQEQASGREQGLDGNTSMDLLPMDFLGEGQQTFTRHNKVISHSFSAKDGMGGLLGDGEDMSQLELVSSMIDYTMELTFDRKVKSVEVSGMDVIEQAKNTVKARIDLGKMLKEGEYRISVKTK